MKCCTLHSQGLTWSKLSETQYTSQPGTQLSTAKSVKCSTLHSQGLSWSNLSETQYTSQPGTQLSTANSVKRSTLHSQGLSWNKLSEMQFTSQPGTLGPKHLASRHSDRSLHDLLTLHEWCEQLCLTFMYKDSQGADASNASR